MSYSTKELKHFADLYAPCLSIRVVARSLGMSFGSAQVRYRAAIEAGLLIEPAHGSRGGEPSHAERRAALSGQVPAVAGRVDEIHTPAAEPRLGVRRYLLTCAQNNTHLHEALWNNMRALAAHYDAEILVARSVYNRFAEAAGMDKKLIIGGPRETNREYWWDTKLKPYFHDDRLELAPGLVWCGELNIIPTTKNPCSGLETYTGEKSSIIPHARVAMRSLPTLGVNNPPKFLYTTGTVTQRNYIQRRAGQLAEFHHTYGALLVEVDAEGNWWARQVIGDSAGVMHDLKVKAEGGKATGGNNLRAITWGDVHLAYGDRVTNKAAWAEGGMLDTLHPDYQFLHDLMDFRTRNPHNQKLPIRAFSDWVKGHRSVKNELIQAANFLTNISRDWCETLVVDSNHNNFLNRWVEHWGDFRRDPENAVVFLQAALHYYGQIQTNGGDAPNMTLWALHDPKQKRVGYLNEDESYVVDDIEMGLHGHERFNGARGGPAAFSRLARKMNAGHIHSAGIWDGAYFGGIMGALDQGYNGGLGSWSQSNVFTYANGKRCIQTFNAGLPWASR